MKNRQSICQPCGRPALITLLLLLSSPQNSWSLIPTNSPHGESLARRQRYRGISPADSRFHATSLTKQNGGEVVSSTASLKEIEREVVRLGRKGRTDQALALYKSHPKPSVRLMNAAIDACSRSRPTRLEEAFSILERSNFAPNVFSFGPLMSACARAGKADRALTLLRSMEEKYDVVPNAVVYSSAIAAAAKSDPPRPKMALKLLKEAIDGRGLSMNVVGYNAALAACANAGDWKRAIGLLELMEGKDSLVKPDSVTYATILSACEKGEKWEMLLSFAKRMEEKNMKLDALAVNSALHACQQLGYAKEALHYLEAMKTATHYARKTAGWKRSGIKQPLQGPDDVALRLAISACARGGAWEDGLRLLNEFEDVAGVPPDVVAYTAAITGCEYAGEWKRSFKLLEEMRNSGVQPNEVTMAAAIGACAVACAMSNTEQQRKMRLLQNSTEFATKPQQQALRLLNIMKVDDSVVNPNIAVYNSAIRCCGEAGDLKGAMQLMMELREYGLEANAVTFGSLMTACERVGSVEGVGKVFKMMKETEVEPNEIIYGAAISCCRKASHPERALKLLHRMLSEKLMPNVATFNTVIVAQVEGRLSEETLRRALITYKIMIESSRDESAMPNRQTYNLLIPAFASFRKPLEAEGLLRKMQQQGMRPDVHLYTVTVTGYERNGQPLKALQLMESMQDDGYDFYSVKVLNSAFKKAVKLVNAVGRGLSSSNDGNEYATFVDMRTKSDDDDALESLQLN